MVKNPSWEASPGALVALLNSGSFVQCDLITITYPNETHIPDPRPTALTTLPPLQGGIGDGGTVHVSS